MAASEFRIADVATAAKVSLGTARRWAREAKMGRGEGRGQFVLTAEEYRVLSQRKKMPSQESGAKGGATTRSRMGPDHYAKIGQSGGEATVDRHGSAFFKKLGKQGGDTTSARHGPEHYVRMGRSSPRRARSEVQYSAKLTDTSVRSIREEYSAGGISQPQLARKWGVTQSTIWNAIHKHTWKHVDVEEET